MPARQADPLPIRTLQPVAVPAAPRSRRWLVAAAVVGLVVLHWTLGTTALREKCTTSDEIAHLTAGCAYWQLNDYRLQPENGNLPQRWHAIPVVLTGAKLPGPEHSGWQTSDVWRVGRSFFYDLGNDSRMMLARGRAMAALWSVATCLLVFCWSRRLFGTRGVMVSLLLAAFCPTMLAHGPLMTSDMCLTFFLLASTWAVWELLFQITPLRLAAGMLAIAGLFLAKMSAALILLIAALLVLVRVYLPRPLEIRLGGRNWTLAARHQQLAAALGVTIVCGLFAYTTLWSAYGFRYWAYATGPLTDAQFYKLNDLETACRITGRPGQAIAALAEHHILPEAYLFGSAYVLAHQKRAAFLNGEYSITGWRHYFPYCFAVKTPLALFGILGLAAVAIARSGPLSLWERARVRALPSSDDANPLPGPLPKGEGVWHLTPLLVLFAIYWLTALQTTLNIGYRHILPTYPALYILCGAAGALLVPKSRTATIALAVLVGLFAAESFAAYPHYLAYFNPLVPRERAYEHLVDSNLDWGQDLPGLARWLKTHNTGADRQLAYISYFGNGRPAYEGIDATPLPAPFVGQRSALSHAEVSLKPGLYCISATTLQAVYAEAPGRWNKAYEERYQARRQLFAQLAAGESPCDAAGRELRADQLAYARWAYDYLQYLRLLTALRHRTPDANVGYSILIFRVSADELDRALTGPPAELDEKPWMPQRLKNL